MHNLIELTLKGTSLQIVEIADMDQVRATSRCPSASARCL